MASTASATAASAAFELKGRMATLTVLRIHTADVGAVVKELQDKVQEAPRLLRGAPMVLDLEGVDGAQLDLQRLAEEMRAAGLAPVAVRGGQAEHHAQAAGLGVLPSADEEREGGASSTAKRGGQAERHAPRPSRVIQDPVRSGQQVYARDRDLVILGAVGAGAEVLADGDIHIYGTLRGRALAGVQGNTEAGVFCLALEAELISVAGHYQVNERFEAEVLGRPARIYLDPDAALRITAFGKP